MRKIVNYFFKPIVTDKMEDKYAQCYNRMWWIWFSVFNPLFTWGTITYFVLIDNEFGVFVSVAITLTSIIINIVQLSLCKFLYKIPGDTSDDLIIYRGNL